MRRMRHAALVAALFVSMATPSLAHERCDCREVLNGRLNTADFDGGVGDRFGDGGIATGGGYVIAYGSASAFGASGAAASASASAHAFAHASISTRIISSFHGGGMHGGGGTHGGSYGGGHR
ncbi:MAG TPA: hypothetical protein VGB91_14265 [Rhizomicrobium sp.]